MAEKAMCSALRRDGSGCQAAANKAFGGKCQFHYTNDVGAEHGFRVRGSNRAQVWVGDRPDGTLFVCDTARELVERMSQATK
jgi:hypothetical protein